MELYLPAAQPSQAVLPTDPWEVPEAQEEHDDAPSEAEYDPAAQLVHDADALLLDLPASHFTHAPSVAYSPEPHWLQPCEPAWEMYPLEHVLHALFPKPAAYWFWPHEVQIDKPIEAVILPPGQLVHDAVPVELANLPLSQFVQAVAAAELNLPVEQDGHKDSPVVPAYLPAVHAAQLDDPSDAEYLPVGQGLHEAADAPLNLPAGQFEQPLAVAYLPAPHASQLVAPVDTVTSPTAQCEQTVLARPTENVFT